MHITRETVKRLALDNVAINMRVWKSGGKVVEKPLTHLEPVGVARIGPGAGNGLPESHRDGE